MPNSCKVAAWPSILVLALVLASAVATAQVDDEALAVEAAVGQGQAKKMEKDRLIRGTTAFDALENQDKAKVDRIAAKHGKSSAQLKKEMQQDGDLAIDADAEQLVYICEGLEASNAPMSAVTAAAVATSAFADVSDPPIGQAFLLHSRPGSSKIIYLDFNGECN